MFSKKSGSEIQNDNYPKLIPQDISPADDAFHGPTKHVAAEWWYFDAIFSNNYSVHVGCKTFSKKNRGIVSPMIEIYKDGRLEVKAEKRYLFRHFQTSKNFPLVKLFNNSIIEFDQERYKSRGEWVYNFLLKIGDDGVNLNFIGTTKGWKIETERESWTVALPKASVTGEILINGKSISVDGTGYHDHNWNYTLLTAMNYGRGWYWAKIRSETMNIVLANIVKTSSRSEILAVVNQDNQGFYSIDPKNIYFKPDKFVRRHRKKTPSIFILRIDDVVQGVPIHADIKMEAKEIHYDRLVIAPYWRYHVKATGFISIGDKKEKVNSTQIMEFLRFI